MNKSFWLPRTDGDKNLDTSRIEPNHAYQWFKDTPGPELFCSKRQAIEAVNSRQVSRISNASFSLWENSSTTPTVLEQFNDRLYGSDSDRSFNLVCRSIPTVGAGNLNGEREGFADQFASASSVGLSMSHTMEVPLTNLDYGGIRQANDARNYDNSMSISVVHSYNRRDNSAISIGAAYNDNNISMGSSYSIMRENTISMGPTFNKMADNLISTGLQFNKEIDSFRFMGHNFRKGDCGFVSTGREFFKENGNIIFADPTYNKQENFILMGSGYKKPSENFIPIGPSHDKGDNNIIPASTISDKVDKGKSCSPSMGQNYDKGKSSAIYFGNFQVESEQQNLAERNTGPNARVAPAGTYMTDANPKSKDQKRPKKATLNNFPSNVNSLLSTGILDGVPVKYVSWSREKNLKGIIKGTGYLCGCKDCKYSKALNAFEFERHAGGKTKHPNNHIYFQNGKSIYAVVRELRISPQDMLFDAIQNVTGSPINRKNFRIWKASFQAATVEVERIYRKNGVVIPA